MSCRENLTKTSLPGPFPLPASSGTSWLPSFLSWPVFYSPDPKEEWVTCPHLFMQKVYENISHEPTKNRTSSTCIHNMQQSYMHIMYLLFVNHTYTHYDPGNSLLYEHSQPRGKQGLNVNPERKISCQISKGRQHRDSRCW